MLVKDIVPHQHHVILLDVQNDDYLRGVDFVLPYPIGLVFLVVVSEIMLYFKVDKNSINSPIFWQKLVASLQHSLQNQQTLENQILVIKLQNIMQEDNAMIPKLEYKNF